MPRRAKKKAMIDRTASEDDLRRNFADYEEWLRSLSETYPQAASVPLLGGDDDSTILEPIWSIETRCTS